MNALWIVLAVVATLSFVLVPWLRGPGTWISDARPERRGGAPASQRATAVAVAAPVVNVVVVPCQHEGRDYPLAAQSQRQLSDRGLTAIETAGVLPAVVLGEQEKVQR